MSPQEFHQRVMELVGAALEHAPHERAAFLDRRCDGNQRLRSEVDSLLDLENKTAAFNAEPIISLRPKGTSAPQRIGPYELLHQVGRGGMGEVYLARQEEPMRRQVALKLIQGGLHRHQILRRFELERDILARLQHPNIARLLDGGTSEDGRPYLVMEYVDGRPVDEYCDRAALSIRQRLELFRKVCSAVQVAHRNLVVHRDLKPGNILVDSSGEPKLLDFGIAKLLHGEPGGTAAFKTAPGRQPMTQAYASPEMITGEGINTLSDIYSLGVVLYRLLSGRHPYRISGRSSAEIDQTIRMQEPKRPSTALTLTKEIRSPGEIADAPTPETVSEMRGTDPRKLRRQLAGDLDCIVLKALRKEPRERYGSVVELSEDILRFLKGLPVAARVDTFRYRAEKFVRRNRFELAMAVAFLMMMVGFVVLLLLQNERVRSERDRANKSHDLFVEIVEKTDPEEEAEILTPEGVVKRGVDLLGESFSQEYELQASVFDSLGRVYTHRGFYERARSFLEISLKMRREVLGTDHLLVAESQLNLSYLLGKMGEYEKAVKLSRRGLKKLQNYYPDPHIELAKAISSHAAQLQRMGDFQEAEALYLKSHEMRIALHGDIHLSVANSLDALGSLYQELRNLDRALESYMRSQEIRERLLPPKHPKLATSSSNVGTILYELGDYARAQPKLRRALEIRLEKLGKLHPSVAKSRYKLALSLQRIHRYDEAEPQFRQAIDYRCSVLGDGHPECANAKRSLAKLLVDQGNPEAAWALASQALEVYESKGDTVKTALVKITLGECLVARGQYSEAEELLQENYLVLREILGDEEHVTEDARLALVRLYQTWGQPAKVEEYRE